MPPVGPGGSLPDQPRFQEGRAGQGKQVGGQGHAQRSHPSGTRQPQRLPFALDARAFPDGGSEALVVIGVLRVHPRGFAGFRRLAGFVETLLGGVATMGMQAGRPAQRVFQPLATRGREPDALLAIQPIVADQHIRVDAPALGIERVGFALGKRASHHDRAHHGRSLGEGPACLGLGGREIWSTELLASARTAQRSACSSSGSTQNVFLVMSTVLHSVVLLSWASAQDENPAYLLGVKPWSLRRGTSSSHLGL